MEDTNAPSKPPQTTTPRELTFGEKLVGVSFNPSKLPQVDAVKARMAACADGLVEWNNNLERPLSYDEQIVYKNALMAIIDASSAVVKVHTYAL